MVMTAEKNKMFSPVQSTCEQELANLIYIYCRFETDKLMFNK